MFFIASKVVWFFLKPFNLLIGAIILGLFGRLVGWRRTGAGLVGIGLAGLLILEFTTAGALALRPLENRFPPPERRDGIDGIIVLGGAGESALKMTARGLPHLNGSAERMTEAVALARINPEALIAFTGYSGDLLPDEGSEADVARRFFRDMGLGADRLVFEARSRNTAENATYLKEMVAPQPGQRWLLVTSAYHMPRSMGVFCKAGWAVIPYPVDYATLPQGSFRITGGGGLAAATTAVHEWVGLAAYRLTGRSTELFPGPASCPGPG